MDEIRHLQDICAGLRKRQARLVDSLGKTNEAIWLAERRLHKLQRQGIEVDKILASMSREQIEALIATVR